MGLRSTIKGLFNKKQDFLEAEPYWDTKDIPINTFKNKAPFTSKVVSTKRIVGAEATGETCHIIMDHQGTPAAVEELAPSSGTARIVTWLVPGTLN